MVERVETILCPVNFSAFSVLALQYAGALAEHYNARLVVYHSVPGQPEDSPETAFHKNLNRRKHAYQDLGKFVRENISFSLETTAIIDNRVPAAAGILERTRTKKADLIVMGTHGFRGQDLSLTGSITLRVLHESPVPVLTVCKPIRNFVPKGPGEQLQIKRILCALDPNHANMRMINLALSLARSFQSTVLFLEVEAYSGQESSVESLRSIIQPEKEVWCKVEFGRLMGKPVEELLNASESLEIDLMIMGHYTRRFPDVLDSVTFRVVPKAPCPVLVLPILQPAETIEYEERHIQLASSVG
ncbi:universal stress protein [bacterium]|nr:universal stress protein [bacterium]